MPSAVLSVADKRQAFRRLHEAGCFVIPNPWDIGSARMLQGLGFKALASTSSGFAWSHARPDNGISRDMALEHLAALVAATGAVLAFVQPYSPWPGVGPQTPSDRNYEGGFAAAMMLKDLKLAQEAAARSGATTPLGNHPEVLRLFYRIGKQITADGYVPNGKTTSNPNDARRLYSASKMNP